MRPGDLCFIDDAFFEKVNDANLKINYGETKRPHIVAFKDVKTSLFWVVPCSSQLKKYKNIISKIENNGKKCVGIKMFDHPVLKGKSAVLFQDMFPVSLKYICPYERDGELLKINDSMILSVLETTARTCVNRLMEGFWFTPTQPNVVRIENIMLRELRNYGR